MPLTHFGFIYTAAGADPDRDVAVVDTGQCKTVLVGNARRVAISASVFFFQSIESPLRLTIFGLSLQKRSLPIGFLHTRQG